jgi:hypothetical protein
MKQRKLAWWQLFALVPIMLGLMVIEQLAPLPGVSPEIVDVGIVLLTFGAMIAWVNINAGLLEWYYIEKDEMQDNFRVTVYEPKPHTSDEDSSEAMQFEAPRRAIRGRGSRLVEGNDGKKWRLN